MPQRYDFFGTLLLTAIATAFLMDPSAHHRVVWRRHLREERLRSANRLTLAGLGCLLLPMTGAIFVVSGTPFGSMAATLASAATTLFFVYLRFVRSLLWADDAD